MSWGTMPFAALAIACLIMCAKQPPKLLPHEKLRQSLEEARERCRADGGVWVTMGNPYCDYGKRLGE